jgi:hypothetical protein
MIGSTRRYGIELETSECRGFYELKGSTIWECKSDCSIAGKEFVTPVLVGDEGLIEIENFCSIANQRRWRVNHYCGYHAHFDVTRESWESLRSIAYAYRLTYPMWCRFVPEDRAHNSYAGAPEYELDKVASIRSASDWDYFVGARDRFEFVNWRSYLVHGSCEVRSHAGTLNAEEVCNWIMLHAKFIDLASGMTIEELAEKFGGTPAKQFSYFEDCIGSELADYYSDKSEGWGNPLRSRVMAHLNPPRGF